MKLTQVLSACLLLVGCQSEIDNKTAAEVAPAATPAPKAGAPAGSLALQPSSKIEWVGAKLTDDHTGGFKTLSGEATVVDGALTSASVKIGLSSLYSDHPKLTKHLLSDDFFDVSQFTTATFEVTEVTAADAGISKVTGTLDLHGMQKSITFPATVQATADSASIAAEFTLLRKDFGMTYPGKPDDLIRDEVLVKGTLRFGS